MAITRNSMKRESHICAGMRVNDDSTSYQRVSMDRRRMKFISIIQGTEDPQIPFITHDSLNDIIEKELKAICQKSGIKTANEKRIQSKTLPNVLL